VEQRSLDELAAVFARHGVATDGRMGAALYARGLIIERTERAAGPRYHVRVSHREEAHVGEGWGETQREAFLQAYAAWLAP